MISSLKITHRLIILLLLFSFHSSIFSQDIESMKIEIKNKTEILKQNKVHFITQTTYDFNKNKRRQNANYIELKEIYDSLGRKIEIINYKKNSNQVGGKIKYFYADTLGIGINRIEYYNDKGILTEIQEAKEIDGKIINIRVGGGSTCYGHYKFNYNDKGLIEEAIWFAPKKIRSGEKMIPKHKVQLQYTYR